MLNLACLILLVGSIAWIAERIERRNAARRELSRLIAQHVHGR